IVLPLSRPLTLLRSGSGSIRGGVGIATSIGGLLCEGWCRDGSGENKGRKKFHRAVHVSSPLRSAVAHRPVRLCSRPSRPSMNWFTFLGGGCRDATNLAASRIRRRRALHR